MKQFFYFSLIGVLASSYFSVADVATAETSDPLRLAKPGECSLLNRSAHALCAQQQANRQLTFSKIAACAELEWYNHKYCLKALSAQVDTSKIRACKTHPMNSWENNIQRKCLSYIPKLTLEQISACVDFRGYAEGPCFSVVAKFNHIPEHIKSCGYFTGKNKLACLNRISILRETENIYHTLNPLREIENIYHTLNPLKIAACASFSMDEQNNCLNTVMYHQDVLTIEQIKACGAFKGHGDTPLLCLDKVREHHQILSPNHIQACNAWADNTENVQNHHWFCLLELIKRYSDPQFSIELPASYVKACGAYKNMEQRRCLTKLFELKHKENLGFLDADQITACGAFDDGLAGYWCLNKVVEFPVELSGDRVRACDLMEVSEHRVWCLEQTAEFPDVLSTEGVKICATNFDNQYEMPCLAQLIEYSEALKQFEISEYKSKILEWELRRNWFPPPISLRPSGEVPSLLIRGAY